MNIAWAETPHAGITLHEGCGPQMAALAAPLVQRKYRERGYDIAPRGSVCGKDLTLVACEANRVCGTLTLSFDDSALQAVEAYPDTVSHLRGRGVRLAEITRLAIDARERRQAVMSALFGRAWTLLHQRPGLSMALIEVHPRHAAFYQRRWGFELLGPERTCRRAQAPCVLLALRILRPASAPAPWPARAALECA